MIFTNHPTQAFVYRWTNRQTGQWYIGSRTAQGCHPEDGYICSSRRLLPLIESNQTNWHREILCVGEPQDMIELECRLLESLDAKNDPLSYNQHNGDGKFTTAGVEPWNKGKRIPRNKPAWNSGKKAPQISVAKKGKPAPNKGVPMSEEQRLKMIEIHNNRSVETCRKISEALKGKTQSEEANAKRSAKLKVRKQSPEWIEKRIVTKRGKPNLKVSASLKGRAKSDQHRANLSKSLTGKPSKRKGVANPKLREYMLANPKQKTVCRLFDQKEMFYGNFLQWERLELVKTKGA